MPEPKPRVTVWSDAEKGVTYYRENDEANPPVARIDLGVIDWLELAKQKQALLELIWDRADDPLWGLVSLIDRLQDEADKQDYPVVWTSCEDGE